MTGHGTGFIMIWRNNVRWSIGQADDPCKFMTVDSGDYVLAIPDFSNYARRSADMMTSHGIRSIERHADDKQTFKKVIMKLSGKVRWLAGLVFERNLEGGGRSFDFEPHHKVTLKNPVHVKHLLENVCLQRHHPLTLHSSQNTGFLRCLQRFQKQSHPYVDCCHSAVGP